MTGKRNKATEQTGPSTSAGAWGLRYPGLVMTTGGKNEVKEFTGMWRLKPDADLVAFTKALAARPGLGQAPGRDVLGGDDELGLIRTARWFVGRTQDFDGYTLFFVSQFDGTLEKYFDDFVLNGKENLTAIWGHCVGCPTGPDVTARDIVEYIARGQIKTLACYDVVPASASARSTRRPTGTRRRRSSSARSPRATANSRTRSTPSCSELAEPYEPVPSGATIDTDVARAVAVRGRRRTRRASRWRPQRRAESAAGRIDLGATSGSISSADTGTFCNRGLRPCSL